MIGPVVIRGGDREMTFPSLGHYSEVILEKGRAAGGLKPSREESEPIIPSGRIPPPWRAEPEEV